MTDTFWDLAVDNLWVQELATLYRQVTEIHLVQVFTTAIRQDPETGTGIHDHLSHGMARQGTRTITVTVEVLQDQFGAIGMAGVNDARDITDGTTDESTDGTSVSRHPRQR